MSVYKISYVVTGSGHPGAIVNQELAPVVGEQVKLGENTFTVVEVMELMPPRGNFYYFHATIRLVEGNNKPGP